MTSPQISDFWTPLPPPVTPVKPWKSPQIAIFCTPLPPPLGWHHLWMVPKEVYFETSISKLLYLCWDIVHIWELYPENKFDKTIFLRELMWYRSKLDEHKCCICHKTPFRYILHCQAVRKKNQGWEHFNMTSIDLNITCNAQCPLVFST